MAIDLSEYIGNPETTTGDMAMGSGAYTTRTNATQELIGGVLQTKFPDLLTKVNGKVVATNPEGFARGDYSSATNTIRLSPAYRGDYTDYQSKRGDYTRGTETLDVVDGVYTALHEINHAARWQTGMSASTGMPEKEWNKFKESLRKSGLPSTASASFPLNEFLAEAFAVQKGKDAGLGATANSTNSENKIEKLKQDYPWLDSYIKIQNLAPGIPAGKVNHTDADIPNLLLKRVIKTITGN
jgi:hypothetical protein